MADDKTPSPLFSFAILTDLHLNELDGREKLSRALEGLKNDEKINFLLLLGDVDWPGSLAEFKHELGSCNLPYHVVAGNHDARRLRDFQDAFGALYYSFEYGDCLFVGLFNASPAADDFHAHHGEIDEQQAEWLRGVLQQAAEREPGFRNVFIFAHVPPLQPGSPMYPAFRLTVDHTDLMYELCREFQVDAAFYGHTHINEAFEYQGTWHITTPSLNWNFNTCFGYDHKDWIAVNYGGYRVVHVHANEISDELRWTHRGTAPIEL